MACTYTCVCVCVCVCVCACVRVLVLECYWMAEQSPLLIRQPMVPYTPSVPVY